MCPEGAKCVTKAAHYNAEALIIFKKKVSYWPISSWKRLIIAFSEVPLRSAGINKLFWI